jgi:16S rRNA (cytosine1402-N4)-methyltransferase
MGSRMSDGHHLPVMVDEVLAHLALKADGAYLDLTSGLGGHLKALSQKTDSAARLYGLDKDSKAVEIALNNLEGISQSLKIIPSSYSNIETVIKQFEDKKFDGILFDLGLSSYQIDNPERGFSFQHDGPLDMRFDSESVNKTAADLVNELDENELKKIFKEFGEERNARKIAKEIVRERQRAMILTTIQLSNLVSRVVPPPFQVKSLARIFQALRIAVNNELEQLQKTLPIIINLLNHGARLVFLTYHSLEDRIVKHFFQNEAKGCICPDRLPVCVCGHTPQLKIITKKAIIPTKAEINKNKRARSAKLRVSEKI